MCRNLADEVRAARLMHKELLLAMPQLPPPSPTPTIIWRYRGEENTKLDDLQWDLKQKYKDVRFAGRAIVPPIRGLKVPDTRKDIPGRCKQAINAFLANLPDCAFSTFTITWNSQNPAFQFKNKKYVNTTDMRLSPRNIYRSYHGTDHYFSDVCDYGSEFEVEHEIEQSLFDKSAQWWDDRYYKYTEFEQIDKNTCSIQLLKNGQTQ